MSCQPGCFESIIEQCNDIIIRANFPPNFSLYWILNKAGKNNLYQRLTTTTGTGDLVIPKSDLPDGFLTPGSYFNIQVRNGSNYLQPVTFLFGGTNYNCALARLGFFDRAADDDSEINVIQYTEALIPDPAPVDDLSSVTPFVNQTSLTINHNLGREVDVTIYDLSGNIIIATITDDIVNHNYITITFSSATSGRVLIQ